MAEYADFYLRTIGFNRFGFKLALGGTGIGKTRGIRETVQKDKASGGAIKFIYCANRIQLLDEMYDKLTQKHGFSPEEVIHLERNRDTVLNAITNSRDDFYKLLENPIIQNQAQSLNLDIVEVKRDCQQIEQIASLTKDRRQDFMVRDLIEVMLEAKTRNVLNFFKNILRNLPDKEHRQLIYQPVIQTLFPYITFKVSPKARVLLLTIHKGFLGFFDGHQTVSMMDFEGNVIFLDEFDFLEADLTDLICNSPQIEDPFLFVAAFYQAMKRHKLPLEIYPIVRSQEKLITYVRKSLIAIVERIDKLREDGVPFPDINQFTTHIERKQAAIFQTNRTIIREPLYLQQTSRSFEILLEKQPDSVHAMILFNLVNWATAEILRLLKEIEAFDSTIYEEMLSQCFPQSYLADQVKKISHLPVIARQTQDTRFDSLLNSGFGLYEIRDLQQVTDPDEVKFEYYAIHTTPEKILLSMAQKNLVFGLSATADIPRFVKHFNDHWLRKQLSALSQAAYFEIDEQDTRLIQELNQDKLNRRQNRVEVVLTKELKSYPDGKVLSDYVKQVAQHFEGFGGDDKNGYRRQRVERFFSTLLAIAENRAVQQPLNDTHLLFYATFGQLSFIFKSPACHNKDLFQIKPISDDKHFAAYRLILSNQAFNVIFYDASQAKYIHHAEDVKQRYHELFWQNVPVVVVTQYASAGNGVNLQYRPTLESTLDDEMDFGNIHLMESPYYFFDEINARKQTAPELSAAIKKNIWYQAKLFEAKVISREVFFGILENLRNHDFNGEYRNGANLELRFDGLKSRLAIFMQALGRIERVWDKPIPDQFIVLAEDVYDDFARFVQDENLAYLREKRLPLLSGNLVQLMTQLDELIASRQKAARRSADERLASQDKHCREYVAELLRRLHAFRNGNGDDSAKREWTGLRLSALEHNFAGELVAKYKGAFKSAYLQDGSIYIDEDKKLYPPDKRAYSANPWRLDAVYDLIKDNPTISSYFRLRGFELEFDGLNGQFFVPYFYQAILVGAIGEVAIRTILRNQFIEVTDDLPDPLFELADLKFIRAPWYIDCKNYSERTLERFHLPPDDPAYRPKLGEPAFITNAQSKLARMREYHGKNGAGCKLIYLNLVGNENRKRLYFDDQFNEVDSFTQAHIILIQGILDSSDPAQYTKPFKQFINDVKGNLPYEG